MRASDQERGERAQPRIVRLRVPFLPRRGSRGASAIEYGLIVALIGAVLCIGIGVTVKSVFEKTIHCFTVGMQGGSDPECDTASSSGGGSGVTGSSTGNGSSSSSPSPSRSPSPSPTPTPTG